MSNPNTHDEPTADRNLEQLLAHGYRPETPEPDFARRVEASLLAAAAERRSAMSDGSGDLPIRRLPVMRRLGGLAVAATLLVGALALGRLVDNAPVRRANGKVETPQDIANAILNATPVGDGMTARPRGEAPAAERVAVGDVIETGATERRRVALPDGSILYVNAGTEVTVRSPREVRVASGEVYVEVEPDPKRTFRVITPDREYRALGTRFAVAVGGTSPGLLVTHGKVEVSGYPSLVHTGQRLLEGDEARAESAPRASHLLDWTRDLVAAAESPLVPGSDFDGGALIAIDPFGQEARLSLRKVHVDVHIEDGFARTTIDQTYFNHATWRMEGTFYFPLPADASLSRLAMYVGEIRMEGGMTERDRARDVFEQIVTRKKDPALLEWVDGSTFKMRVFPLEPREEKRIVISYVQRLETLYGETRYRFPSGHTLGLTRDWSFKAHVAGGANAAWSCPSHELSANVADGALDLSARRRGDTLGDDVVLRLRGAPTADGDAQFRSAVHEGQRYLMLRTRPELPTTGERARRDWVFLFESAGNRTPIVARVQADVVRTMLAHAEAGDTFTVVTAGTRTRALSDNLIDVTPANVEAALDFLERSHLIGALDLARGLRHVRRLTARAENPYVVHVGSGVSTLGERDPGELAKMFDEDATYVGVAVGRQWSRTFMKAAAARTGGFFTQINPDEPVTWRTFDLVSTLGTPRLLDVRVVDDAEQATFLSFSDAVAHGEEIAAVTRVADGAELPDSVTVAGTLDGESWSRTYRVEDVEDGAGYLPRQWARLEIDRLVTADAAGNRDAIVTLSKDSYVMSPFTSLLVLENEAMYEQFKVDRGRKDHWALYPAPDRIPVVKEPLEGHAPQAPDGKPAEIDDVLRTIVVRLPVQLTYSGNTQWQWAYQHQGQSLSVWDALNTPVRTPWGLASYGWSTETYSDRSPPSGSASASERLNAVEAFKESRGSSRWGDWGGGWRQPVADGSFRLRFDVDGRRFQGGRLRNGPFGIPVSGPMGGGNFAWRFGAPISFARPSDASGSMWPGDDGSGGGLAGRFSNFLASGPYVMSGSGGGGGARLAGANLWLRSYRYGSGGGAGGGHGTAGIAGGHAIVRTRLAEPLVSSYLSAPGGWFGNSDVGGQFLLPAGSEEDSDSPRFGYGYSLLGGFGSLSADQDMEGLGYIGGFVQNLHWGQQPPGLMYQRPYMSNSLQYYGDLTQFAPGLQTTGADIERVIADEADGVLPERGEVHDAARRLIERSRRTGWVRVSVPDRRWRPRYEALVDGSGRLRIDRRLPCGLRELVVADGSTLRHLYAEIGLGAVRPMSHHYEGLAAAFAPWIVPEADVLALGANVNIVDERTVEIVPVDDDSLRIHLVFGVDGRLTERRFVDGESGKTLGTVRIVFEDDQVHLVFVRDDGKEIEGASYAVAEAAEPSLAPDTSELVVLPMPYRTPEHVQAKHGLGSKPKQDPRSWTEGEALEFVAANFGRNYWGYLQNWVRRYATTGDTRLGFYTLMLASGHRWNPEDDQSYGGFENVTLKVDPRPDHPDSALAHFVARQATRQAYEDLSLPTSVQGDGFVTEFSEFTNMCARWTSGRAHNNQKNRLTEKARLFERVETMRDPNMAWGAMSLLWTYAGLQADEQQKVATLVEAFNDVPQFAFHARYEHATALQATGKAEDRAEATRLFRELHTDAIAAGVMIPIDGNFAAGWRSHERETFVAWWKEVAANLIGAGNRPAVVHMALQTHWIGDPALAEEIVELALRDLPDMHRVAVTLAAVQYYWHAGSMTRARTLVDRLLEDDRYAEVASIWTLASALADREGATARAVLCQERALDLQFAELPDVVDLNLVRQQYGSLLARFQQLATAVDALGANVDQAVIARVVRSADRWRALDPDPSAACQLAASILSRLGDDDLAWDYLTTPLGAKPNEGAPWHALATQLVGEGRHELADRAYATAFEIEPTNAQFLWDRAQALRNRGEKRAARDVYRVLAEGEWQPRFSGLKANAKQYAD